MDERLKKALDIANLMVAHNTQRNLAKQEFNEKCLYHENGHRFTINRELINFLSTFINMDYLSDVVILDDFENPYMISDVKEFFNNILSIYIEATNSYYYKIVDLKSKRTISKLMDIE